MNFKRIKQKLKHMTSKQIALSILCGVLAVILLIMLGATIYLESMLNRINREVDDSTMSSEEYDAFLNSQTETVPHDFTGETIHPDDVQWEENSELIAHGKNYINILLIGQDRRPGEGRQRSDAIILCTVNKKDGSVTMTSFMRDMYVQIPGYQDDRITACYPLGGMKLLDECIEKNFGIRVDGNVEVDFDGFAGIIDAMGGVDIELTDAEARYLNGYYHWNLSSGLNTLNGEQALGYARNRSIGNSDFERTNRQRKVVNALIERSRSLSLKQIDSLLKELLPMVTTDLTNSQIMGYAADVFPMLKNISVVSQRVPADGMFQSAMIRGMDVLLPDLEASRQMLKDTLAK